VPAKLDQIRSLLTLAADERTPIEEARNAALAAARLIVRGEYTVLEKGNGFDFSALVSEIQNEAPRRRWPEAGPSPRGFSREKKPEPRSDVVITARSAGFCEECGDTYPKGSRVIWQGKDRRIVHRECHSARRGTPSDLG